MIQKSNAEDSKPEIDHRFRNAMAVCVASTTTQMAMTLTVMQAIPVQAKEYCVQLVNYLLVDKLVKTIARPELLT